MGMLAGKHFAKPDPRHFQYRILQQYEIRVETTPATIRTGTGARPVIYFFRKLMM